MKNFYRFIFLMCCSYGMAQVGINTTRPNAQLDIKSSNPASPSNTDGILIPNIDVFPSKKPGAEQNGMMVYLAKQAVGYEPGFYFWDNEASQWKSIGSSVGNNLPNPGMGLTGPTWLTSGNAGVTGTDFLGTTDNADLIFKRNNVKSGIISTANTGFGAGALNSGSGTENTAVGAYTLYNGNASSNYNTGLGYMALYYNTSGNDNTAVGNKTLQLSTSGQYNVAVGSKALQSNTTGGSNTAIGNAAMLKNTAGYYNTGAGNNVLSECTTCQQNAAFGNSASSQSRTGYGNTSVGAGALSNNTAGSNNVGIGFMAGHWDQGSNKLHITGFDTNTPLVYGEFDNQMLRFNGKVKVHNVATPTSEMLVKNSNIFVHAADANLNFGTGGNDFIVSTNEGINETGGIRGDGDNVTIWSPGDGYRLVRFVDEDSWSDNNGNPYDNAAEKAYIDPNGQYFQVSDKNKKDNIRKIDNPIGRLEKLNGYTYEFKLSPDEISKGQKAISCSGVLAQELEAAFPEAVQKNESGEYFVDYAAITPLLVEAVKVQQATIDVLEARLKDVEAKLK